MGMRKLIYKNIFEKNKKKWGIEKDLVIGLVEDIYVTVL